MRHANGGKDQEGEQAEQHERADETELLGQQGEHEVGMGLGKKPAPACDALPTPLPKKPPEPTAIMDCSKL